MAGGLPPGGRLRMRSVSWWFLLGTWSSSPGLSSRVSPCDVAPVCTNGSCCSRRSALSCRPRPRAGWPIGLLLFVALVLAPAVRDFRCHAQYRWISLLVGLGILASIPVRTLVGMSDPWRTFAAWLVG